MNVVAKIEGTDPVLKDEAVFIGAHLDHLGVRNNAVFWIVQSRAANRVGLLNDIYKNSMDNSKIRQQVLFALNQTREPQAVTIIGNIASTDPDIEVRKQAVFWLGQNKSPEANQALEKLLQRK